MTNIAGEKFIPAIPGEADGHMAAVRVNFKRKPELRELREALSAFRSLPQELGPFPWTTLNVPAELIDKDPQLIKGLVERSATRTSTT